MAGAGTGKTRVLTTRLSYILHQKLVNPYETLTVTFTNKAANEMKNRIEEILQTNTAGWWIGTFHSMAARILRRHPEVVGLRKQFTIIDTDDQIRLLKQVLSYHDIDEKRWPAKGLSDIIQRWKDKGCNPDNIDEKGKQFGNNKGAELYNTYQNRLKSLNVVDYGDLLLQNLNIFNLQKDILQLYQNQFKYILVDEYQDTNVCQYNWLKLLAAKYNNICVVGDDDQSIYSWRGAEVGNILRFEKEYSNSVTIKLEKNYRSTGNILDAANQLISNNKKRMGKTLWTDEKKGDKIEIVNSYNGETEAVMVSDKIEEIQSMDSQLNSIAILVRASYQTRFFEDRLIKIGLPYRIIGGTKFYERLEIKDALAYLRVTVSDYDDLAFERIINIPKRGIGKKALRDIEIYARNNQISLLSACQKLCTDDYFNSNVSFNLKSFFKLLSVWRTNLDNMSAEEATQIILEDSGYTDLWQKDKSIEAEGRLENLKELISAISEFENINSFLEHIQLVMDNNLKNDGDAVNLLTLHAAKGLEFEYVFLPGWEEDIFPNRKSLEEKLNAGLEEERRLAYVGLTRARKKALISYANNRIIHGQWFYSLPSRFIKELPEENIKGNNLEQFSKINTLEKNNNYFSVDNFVDNRKIETIHSIIKIGNKVFHQKFGYGTVKSIEGESAEVEFDKTNIKKIKKEFLSTDV